MFKIHKPVKNNQKFKSKKQESGKKNKNSHHYLEEVVSNKEYSGLIKGIK